MKNVKRNQIRTQGISLIPINLSNCNRSTHDRKHRLFRPPKRAHDRTLLGNQLCSVADEVTFEECRREASHHSDSERRIVLHHETDSGPTHLVPYNAAGGAYKSFGNGTRLTTAGGRDVSSVSSGTAQGVILLGVLLPHTHAVRTGGDNLTDEDRLDRTALRRATRYLCDRTFGCQIGDCLCSLQQSDVLQFRQQFMQRKIAASGKMIPQKDLLVADLARAWNRSTDVWETLILAVDDVTSVRVCPASYGLLCGVASSLPQSRYGRGEDCACHWRAVSFRCGECRCTERA